MTLKFKLVEELSHDGMITEARKKKKKYKLSNRMAAGIPIFKSTDDIKKWVKKRQKGWGSFVHIDNCGNMDYNNKMFNKMNGSDSNANNGESSTDSVTNISGIGDIGGGDAAGGATVGGMGESLDNTNDKKKISPKVKNFILEHQQLINDEEWDDLFEIAEEELNMQEQADVVQMLLDIGCDFEVLD